MNLKKVNSLYLVVKKRLPAEFIKISVLGSWMTFVTVLVGILGYFFQIILGRVFIPSEYGIFISIMALSSFILSPASALFMLISRKVSTLISQNLFSSLYSYYLRINLKCFIYLLISFFIILFFLDFFKVFFKFPKNIYLEFFILFIIFSIFFQITTGFLQGMQSFIKLGLTFLISTFLKLGICLSLVFYGFGVNGALFGIFLSTFLSFMIGSHFVLQKTKLKRNNQTDFSSELPIKGIFSVICANVAFAAMTQLDVVAVKLFFSDQQTAMYSAASVLGKSILYLSGGLVLALFPIAVDDHAKGGSGIKLITQTLGLCFCSGMFLSTIFFFYSREIINLLFGEDYLEAMYILKWYGFVMIPMCFVMIAEHFLIARGRVLFVWIFIVIAPIQLLLFYLFRDIDAILMIMFFCGSILTFIGFIIMWKFVLFKK